MLHLLHFNYHFKKWFSTKASTEGEALLYYLRYYFEL